MKRRTAGRKTPKDEADGYVGRRVRMRRLMLGLSQTELAERIGVTFQQVQKYEKGMNRISASRLQRVAHVLQVPVPFFFEGIPMSHSLPNATATVPSFDYVSVFLATSDGLALTKAFTQITNAKLRRRIVELVEYIAGDYRE